MKTDYYESPVLRVNEITVESGFAQSEGNGWPAPDIIDESGNWNDNGTI